MDYKEMENKIMEFIKIEPNLSDEQADAQAKSLAKDLGLSITNFWDLLDLTETSFYNSQLFEKCIKAGKVVLR